MQLFFNRTIAIALLTALAIFVGVRGLVPALTKIDSDFPNYFTAAKIVIDGGATERLYDDSWFKTQVQRYEMDSQGKFSPFPPPTALLLTPLAHFEPLTALRWLTVFSLLCLAGTIYLLARTLSWGIVDAAVFVLLSGFAIVNGFRLGQPYILASLLLVLGYRAYVRKKPISAGIWLGVFLPIKYYSATVLLYFALHKNWKVVTAGCATAAAVIALGLFFLGLDVHTVFLRSVLGNHLTAQLTLQDPFSVSYQSFDSLFHRLLVFDAVANPAPWISVSGMYSTAIVVAKAALFVLTIATIVKIKNKHRDPPAELCIGIFGVLALLTAPATATYHFVLLWLPVGLLVQYFLRERAYWHAYSVLGAYAAIGFFPYRLAFWFVGKGILTLLAYPRLWLLLAIFAVAVSFAWRTNSPVSHEAARVSA